jgi:hypothetical protein
MKTPMPIVSLWDTMPIVSLLTRFGMVCHLHSIIGGRVARAAHIVARIGEEGMVLGLSILSISPKISKESGKPLSA